MAASKSAQTATPGLGSRARVTSRARSRVRTPIEGGFVRSRSAPASEASVAAASALIDQRRGFTGATNELDPGWARKVGAGIGAVALTVFTGIFVAALIAGSMFGLIIAILNTHR